MANIVTCLDVKAILAIAPNPANRFIQFPKTNGREASPGNPKIFITGSHISEMTLSIPV